MLQRLQFQAWNGFSPEMRAQIRCISERMDPHHHLNFSFHNLLKTKHCGELQRNKPVHWLPKAHANN